MVSEGGEGGGGGGCLKRNGRKEGTCRREGGSWEKGGEVGKWKKKRQRRQERERERKE